MNDPIPQISKAKRESNLYPLSFGQQQLLYLHELGQTNTYNMPIAMHLVGQLDIELFEDTLKIIIKRHGALRTSYKIVHNQVYQAISPANTIDNNWNLEIINSLVNQGSPSFGQAILEAKSLALQSFDIPSYDPFIITPTPLFKSYLIVISNKEYIWLTHTHHSIFDGRSQVIFLNEVSQLYNSKLANEGNLSPLPITYTDYSIWQTEQLAKVIYPEQLEYWAKKLKDSNPFTLPYDYMSTAQPTYEGERETIYIESDIQQKLKSLATANGTTLFSVMLALFNCLLLHSTGETDITIGTVTANRSNNIIKNQISNIIGYFANTVAIRTVISGEITFKILLERVKNIVKESIYQNSDVPFHKVVERLKASSATSNPLFNIIFVFQDRNYQTLNLKDLISTPIEESWKTAKFDLAMEIRDSEKGLLGFIEYNKGLYDRLSINNLIKHFVLLCSIIPDNLDQQLNRLSLINDYDTQFWRNINNKLDYDYLSLGIMDVIESVVRKDNLKDKTAIKFYDSSFNRSETTLSFDNLIQAVYSLAIDISLSNLPKQSRIGICVPRSPEMVIIFLAIEKAGHIAVPLETRILDKKIILHKVINSNIQFIITSYVLQNLKIELEKEMPDLDIVFYQFIQARNDNINKEYQYRLNLLPRAENIAYIEYTSGTTGFPKGVPIPNKALTNWSAYLTKYKISNSDKVYLCAPLTFDAAIWEMLCLCLAQGAQLIINSDENRLDINAINSLFIKEGVTIATFTPTMLKQFSSESLQTLRILVLTGENLYYEDIKPWLEKGIVVINGYGPTEVGVGLSVYEVEGQSDKLRPLKPPIGYPISNTCMYILNAEHKLAPVGTIGEIAVGGVGLTPGYENNIDSSSFIRFTQPNGEVTRLYLTGDKGKLSACGYFEFFGRINNNNQVKLNGVRIELDNLKRIMLKFPAITNAEFVVSNNDSAKTKFLSCYIVPKQLQIEFSAQDLMLFLIQNGISYQIFPITFFIVNNIPINKNGKIDFEALINQSVPNILPIKYFIPPQSEIELALEKIIRNTLNVPMHREISINDHFLFDLGGSSFSAMELKNTVQNIYGYYAFPELANFFSNPTIKFLSEYIISHALENDRKVSLNIK